MFSFTGAVLTVIQISSTETSMDPFDFPFSDSDEGSVPDDRGLEVARTPDRPTTAHKGKTGET